MSFFQLSVCLVYIKGTFSLNTEENMFIHHIFWFGTIVRTGIFSNGLVSFILVICKKIEKSFNDILQKHTPMASEPTIGLVGSFFIYFIILFA